MQPIPEDVKAAFDQKLAYLKSFKPELEPKGEISRDERGIWRCTYKSQWAEEGILICMYPDGRCFEMHGTIGTKWMYEVGSWIGLPVSDEESDGPDHQVSHFEHGDIRWSRSADKCEVIPKDKLSWYNYRHTELLGYLQQAVAISQPQRHEEALKAVQKKCIEDQFDVVLLGEFQEGKSTTLDVLCRGRELSPQGDGLKSTSAVPVSIEAARPEFAPEGMSEWAELRFKTESELKDELFDAFEMYLSDSETNVADSLKEFVNGDGNGTSRENFRERFDWKNAEHVGRVRTILQNEWTAYAGDKGFMATHHRQQLEALTIYLKYYETPEYKALVEKTIIPVSDVGQYVYFPKDWKDRAPERLDFDLTFQECAFAFLDYAVIYINSDILTQLNCRVTDCPGLGASAYDTAIARRALSRADGVWFVKKCDKQLGESTLGQIFELIRDNGRLERTGMALNLWGKKHKECLVDNPKNGRCLVNYCKDQLEKEGYKFPIFWCNARFAYLSALGKRKIEDGYVFSPAERDWMWRIDEDRIDSSLNDEDLWLQAVKEANHIPCVKEIDGIMEFGLEAVDLLWKHSNFAEALEIMAKIVLEQKGHAILIENGSKKAFDVLARYEHELQLSEDNARKDAEQVRAELDNARKRMERFVQEAKVKADGSLLWTHKRQLSSKMADDFVLYSLNQEFCESFAKSAARVIYNLNKGFGGVLPSDFKKKFFTEINPLLEDAVQERFNSFSANEWKVDSVAENVSEFFERIENLNTEMRRLVEELETDGSIFGRLPMPKISASGLDPSVASRLAGEMLSVVDRYRTGFLENVWELLKLIFGGWLKRLFFGGRSDAGIIADMARKLTRDVERILDSHVLRDEFKRRVQPAFEDATDVALKQLNDGISSCEHSFEVRCQELEAANVESAERKYEIAVENRKIRTERVQPLREKLEAFEKAVEGELKR